jgi:hypothetical protein
MCVAEINLGRGHENNSRPHFKDGLNIMNLVDRLKSAHSFHGDPLHREAWEEIERLEKELYLRANDFVRIEVNLGVKHGETEEYSDYSESTVGCL